VATPHTEGETPFNILQTSKANSATNKRRRADFADLPAQRRVWLQEHHTWSAAPMKVAARNGLGKFDSPVSCQL
jgi:hypothetical protein